MLVGHIDVDTLGAPGFKTRTDFDSRKDDGAESIEDIEDLVARRGKHDARHRAGGRPVCGTGIGSAAWHGGDEC